MRHRLSHPVAFTLLALAGLAGPPTAAAQNYNVEQNFPGPGGVSSYGIHVALDGSTLAIGDALVQVGSVVNAGQVEVFVKQGGAWVFQQRIGGTQQRDFAGTPALDGDTLAIGAPSDLSGRPGKVSVYVRSGGTWTLQQTLSVGPAGSTDLFGSAVALSGNTLVVTAASSGATYFFERSGSTWALAGQVSLSPGVRSFDDNVDVSGTTACVGAPGSTLTGNAGNGTVRIYERTGGTWALQQSITGPVASSDFGTSCALSGNTLIVGASGVDGGGFTSVGAAYVYVRSGTTWTLQRTLTASDPPARRFFGVSVALAGDEAVVGAPGSPGTVYVFRRTGTTWTQIQRIADTAPARSFGNSVDLDAATLLVGSGNNDDGAVTFSRSAVPPVLPGAPASFAATVSGNTVNMTWGAPASGGAPTSYTILARLAAGGPVVASLPVGAATTFGIIAPNGRFVISVRAANAAGTGPESAPVTVTVPQAVPVPGAPTSLAVSVAGNTATFTWSPPASGGAVARYMLLAGLTPGFTVPFASLSLSATPGTVVPGIPPGTYYARVIAMNGGGTSPPSNDVTITVAGPSAPGAPTLHPASVSGNTVTLSWTPGTGGAPAGYVLYASLTSGGAPIASVPVGGTGIAIPGVPPGTYYVQVVARNAVGNSPPSNQVMLTVP